MAKIDLTISSLGNNLVDLREIIPGDSFNWSWVRPLSQVNYLAIHHTAGPDNQTPEEIANYHINNNGWGGIGYHFLISQNGTVYYVGDISTARANVANLNEQVIGICLIGNFTSGRVPVLSQLNSAQKLCGFFINNYPDLSNINSWDCVRGHKDLPGQSTVCPGDTWQLWRSELVTVPAEVAPVSVDRGAQITESYRKVLGRDPDMGGLQTYTNGPLTIDQIILSMVESPEHREILAHSKDTTFLKSQVDSLQASLTSVNQQVISLQEALQERDQQIAKLKQVAANQPAVPIIESPLVKIDSTMTIIGVLIKLLEFIFPTRKEQA